MEFLNALVETEESKKYKKDIHRFGSYEENGYRGFNHIIIGENVRLSIQASCGHYCSPRLTIDPQNYGEMEFAVIKDENLVNVKEVLGECELAEKLEERFDGSVYSYVPVEHIEELYQAIKL